MSWDERFIQVAEVVAGWSKDPSTKCGAVIVRPDKTIASTGYNGFPKGCQDSEELYADRDLKLSRVIHAEVNAILFARERLEGYTIYTYPASKSGACDRCAAHIIQAGITRIVNPEEPPGKGFSGGKWEEAMERALQLFKEAGVKVDSI